MLKKAVSRGPRWEAILVGGLVGDYACRSGLRALVGVRDAEAADSGASVGRVGCFDNSDAKTTTDATSACRLVSTATRDARCNMTRNHGCALRKTHDFDQLLEALCV
jgi:hypothetical protein